MVISTHNSPLFDMYRFLPGADTVPKMTNFSRWEQPPSGRWLPIVAAPDVVSQEPKLHTATKLLNQNIGMHAIPALTKILTFNFALLLSSYLRSPGPGWKITSAIDTVYIHRDIQSRKLTLSWIIPESSRYSKVPKTSTTLQIKETVGISIGTDGQ